MVLLKNAVDFRASLPRAEQANIYRDTAHRLEGREIFFTEAAEVFTDCDGVFLISSAALLSTTEILEGFQVLWGRILPESLRGGLEIGIGLLAAEFFGSLIDQCLFFGSCAQRFKCREFCQSLAKARDWVIGAAWECCVRDGWEFGGHSCAMRWSIVDWFSRCQAKKPQAAGEV